MPIASVAWNGARLVPIMALECGCTSPITITTNTLTRNTAAGSISSLADSAIPNMLTDRQQRQADQRDEQQMVRRVTGNTLPRLAAPAARLTATVST